jgi:hypothetical protein
MYFFGTTSMRYRCSARYRTENGLVAKAQINDAEYYRLCAAEMMTKAQAAPSKATRRAYLNLAVKWSRQADSQSDAAVGTAGRPPAGHPFQEN